MQFVRFSFPGISTKVFKRVDVLGKVNLYSYVYNNKEYVIVNNNEPDYIFSCYNFEYSRAFAEYYHGNQRRKYANFPYIIHPFAVADMCAEHTDDINIIVAANLHDVIEDTCCLKSTILEKFGQDVLELVEGCTNPSQVVEEYKNLKRKERKQIDLDWIIQNPKAHLIKAMDIYNNMYTSIHADLHYMKSKVVPEKQIVLDHLIVTDEVRSLVQNSLEMVKKL